MEDFNITLEYVFNFDESPCQKGPDGYYTVAIKGSTEIPVRLPNYSRDGVSICPLVNAVG